VSERPFRRSARLLISPVVVALGGIAFVRWSSSWPSAVAVVAVLYWVVSAVAAFIPRFMVNADRIETTGYFGGPSIIASADAISCRYVRWRMRNRSVDVFLLEIAGASGVIIRVWRFGWGHRRRELFSALDTWLRSTNVTLDADCRRFVDSARN
jgi:hypothetical protein